MSGSMALASLTATYTDSEGEEEGNDDEEQASSVIITTPNVTPKSNSNSRPSTPIQTTITSKVMKLVSYAYHDDTFVSDEEGDNHDGLKTIVNIIKENPVIEPEPIEEDGIQLPPEPAGTCSLDLQEKIVKLHEKMQNNVLDMNALIQQRKDFRNPSIYEKLIQFCGINELGTNYPPEQYDPLRWGKESFYEDLANVQKTEMEKREKERKLKIEIMTGTKKQEDDAKKRKSKWDQPGGNGLGSQSLKPAGLVQPSLTSSATGTKSTIISAFGSLPKKPRP